jgi:hypothetical protein
VKSENSLDLGVGCFVGLEVAMFIFCRQTSYGNAGGAMDKGLLR